MCLQLNWVTGDFNLACWGRMHPKILWHNALDSLEKNHFWTFTRCSGTRRLQEACEHEAVSHLVLKSQPCIWCQCSYLLHYKAQRTCYYWNNCHMNASTALAVSQQAITIGTDPQCTNPSFSKGGTLLSLHIFGLLPATTMDSCCFWCHCCQQCDDMTTVLSLIILPCHPVVTVRGEMLFLSLVFP